MTHTRKLTGVLACLAAIGLIAAAFPSVIDPATRTASTSTLSIAWDSTNPEEIVSLSWNGSPNLTNAWTNGYCSTGGDLEFFGNAWGTGEGADFVSFVGWGTTGSWAAQGRNGVRIASSADVSTCFGNQGVPVQTRYHLWDHGAPVNRIQVQRRFGFGSTAFDQDFRPYIPRLYPRSGYNQVLHPDAAGSSLLTVDVVPDGPYENGAEVTDWDGSWFAVHNPTTGQGMIVRHAPSTYTASLWIDSDAGSETSSTSVLLKQPAGGFTGNVVDTQFMCFYDASTWTPSLTLPPGC